jgi:hypothetical protein
MTSDETAGGKSLRIFSILTCILSLAAGVGIALAIDNPILSFFTVLLVGGLLELLLVRDTAVEA